MIHENVTQPSQQPTEIVSRLSSLTSRAFVIREGAGFSWELRKVDFVTYGWSSTQYSTAAEAQAAGDRAMGREFNSTA